MRLWLFLFIGLVGIGEIQAGLPLPAPARSEPQVSSPLTQDPLVRIPQSWVSWNLEWFPGRSPLASWKARKVHEEAVRGWLGRMKPVVGIFQEVLDAEAMRRAAPDLPWQAVTRFARAEDEENNLPPQNVAICSQVPWKEAWEVDFDRLPMTPDRPVRGFLGVEWQTQERKKCTAYAVHLKSNRGGREAATARRERAMEYLRTDWERRGLDPQQDVIVIGGDFNCSLKNPEFEKERTIRRLLEEGWRSATQELPWPKGATVRPNWERKYPAADFDTILLSPGWCRKYGSSLISVGVLQGADVPSDHWPVWFRWSEAKTGKGSVKK